jgi:hypothetical protein
MSDAKQNISKKSDQNKQSERIILEQDGIKFEAIEPSQLASVPVISQAFDNQWFPKDLLKEALEAGEVSDDLERRRSEMARAEYIRSLINGEQVVINRAFFINNPVIFQDYLPPSSGDPGEIRIAHDKREAFKKMLEENIIIPYLIQEKSPIQEQAFGTINLGEWKRVCQEVQGMQCVRLSWDDKDNSRKTKRLLAGRFERFAVSMGTQEKNLDQLARDLGLKEADEEALKRQFLRVTQKSADLLAKNTTINREDLYKAFVTIEGTGPVHRHYDKSKLFAGQIKELLDLAQVRNLSDALDGYLLTPVNSLTRTALQESFDDVMGGSPSRTFVEDTKQILQRKVFDLVQSGAYLESMNLLSLVDVYAIRKTQTWDNYIKSLRALLREPLTFGDQAQAVFENYYLLAERMTDQISSRHQQNMTPMVAKTTFVIEVIIEIAGGIISLVSAGDPQISPIIQIITPAFAEISRRTIMPFTISCVIRDIANRHARKELSRLSNRIELMKGKITNAEGQWKDLLLYIKSENFAKEGTIVVDKSSTLTPP